MAISPINITRVSHNLRADSLLQATRRSSLELLLLQNRLATGRAFLSASEDPVAASQALDLHRSLDQSDQIVTNIQHASSFLDASDAALSDVSSLLIDAHDLAIRDVESLTSASERQAAAEEVASIIRQLVDVGNRQFGKTFLFAGRDTSEAPFVSEQGGVVYRGDTGDVLARVSTLEQQPINLPGNLLFGALSSRVRGTVDLSPALSLTTRLDEVRGADGAPVDAGTLVINDASGAAAFSVDLTGADTLGDVVDSINAAAQAAGAGIAASLSADSIMLSSGAPAAGSAAWVGLPLRRVLSPTTPIADLSGGTGITLTSLVITNGPASATIDLSEATTVQEILNAINAAGVNVRAQINDAGAGIDVLNQVSGTSLSIGEAGGSTASALGIRTLDVSTPLAELNSGAGVQTNASAGGTPASQAGQAADLRITAKNGMTVDVDLDGAVTVGDVITKINDAATMAGVTVNAGLASTGSGIRLADATGGSGNLSVSRLNGSFAADDLGLVKSTSGAATELVGDDVGAVRPQGVLTDLIDLERALRSDDTAGINAAGERLGDSIDELNRVHGVIGARAQAMQARLEQTQDAVASTQAFLSQVEDVDFTEAATRFQQAQTTLQGILLTGARLLNVSLLDFLG